MDYGLSGKRVLITGSSGGLGGAMARHFARAGARVIVHGRDAAKAQATAADIREAKGEAVIVLGELATDAGAAKVAADALSAFGGVDVLVNNAGGRGALTATWFEVTPQQWLEQYSGDTVSAVRIIQALAPGMIERRWGRIINISTGAALKPFPIGPQYSAAKGGLQVATVSLAATLGGQGVTVNTIIPGAIHTDGIEFFWRKMAPERGWGENWDDIERSGVREFTPNMIGRLGKPDEIAAAALFLASEGASYITGASLRVDGGAVGTV